MHATKPREHHPRARRLDPPPRCTFSDCCGAPIMPGGVCSHCRELCEDEDGEWWAVREEAPPSAREARADNTNIRSSGVQFREYESSSPFEAMILKLIGT